MRTTSCSASTSSSSRRAAPRNWTFLLCRGRIAGLSRGEVMSRSYVLFSTLVATLLLSLAACTGGGGGGGDDDDDTPPPTPVRPGWAAIRFKTPAAEQVMSVRILDGTTSLADLVLPAG